MNYDLYRELKAIADSEYDYPGEEFPQHDALYRAGYDAGQIDLAKKVLNAYARDNGKRPAPYPEVE